MFQYEVGKITYNEKGEPQYPAADTARNRIIPAYKSLGLEPPQWAKELPLGFDPASLTKDQQFTLFLADHIMDPNSDLGELKTMPLDEWWGRYHQTTNDPVKRERFRRDMAYYQRKKDRELAQRNQKQAKTAKTFSNSLR